MHARRPFPPPALVRAGAATICVGGLADGPRLIIGDVVPHPSPVRPTGHGSGRAPAARTVASAVDHLDLEVP